MGETGELGKFVKDYAHGETVFRENTSGKEMYVIYSGRIRLYKDRPGNRSMHLATLKAGDFFGEMALVDQSPRSATAVADEDTKLLVLDEAKFLYLLRNQPHFALAIMHRLSDRLREADVALAKRARHPAGRKQARGKAGRS